MAVLLLLILSSVVDQIILSGTVAVLNVFHCSNGPSQIVEDMDQMKLLSLGEGRGKGESDRERQGGDRRGDRWR